MDADAASSSNAASAAPAASPPATGRQGKRVKKHATVYQKNALYGAYRFWRKKNEDLKARGVDVSFEWKELFEFFGFAKTTGFKVIKDADQDPSTLLRRDEAGKVETRGRKPKMNEEQIQAVEKLLEGQDPFQEGIEWKVIANKLDLDVHKHTVRRTIRRTLQSRRKSSVATPTRPAPANTNTTTTNTPNNPPQQIQPAPPVPSMQQTHHDLASAGMAHTPTMTPHTQSLAPTPRMMQGIPPNLDPRIMAMSTQHPHPHPHAQHLPHPHQQPRANFTEAEMARMLSNAS